MTERYKFLHPVDTSIKSESGNCYWQIGEWQQIDIAPELCEHGFHCSQRAFDAFSYVHGSIVARVEVDGLSDTSGDKEAWQRMRIVQAWHWRKADSVRLAIFAAEKVIGLYEKQYPHDERPRKAIEAAKAWLENPNDAADAAADAADAADAAGETIIEEINVWMEAHVAQLEPYAALVQSSAPESEAHHA